jgi:hypothetical protein
MNAVAKFLLILVVPFLVALTTHDIFVFADARERIDWTIAQVPDRDRQPTKEVLVALKLDDISYWQWGFNIYREEHQRRGWTNFHSNKILAIPAWALELWIWYDRRSLTIYALRKLKADQYSYAAFGKGINELTAYELDCVARFVRTRRYRMCPEMAPVLNNYNAVN